MTPTQPSTDPTVATQSYAEKLHDIGITIQQEYINAHTPISIQCNNCLHIWTASPISKMTSFRKYHNNGCPNCDMMRKHSASKKKVLETLSARDIQVITVGYDGHQQPEKIHVKNNICGHDFHITPTNLLHKQHTCPICSKKEDSICAEIIELTQKQMLL